jgi:ligand-binding SRPBCC domain-containing protein
VVTNAVGTTNSDVATLTVLVPPAITAQPSNRTVLAGSNVSFQVTASGVPPPGFQWFFDGTNLAGANASVLAFTNVQPAQAGSYSVQVTNAGGSTNSLSVTLVVLVPPTITSQPSNLTVLAGADISLQVAADGIPSPNYQWLLDGTNVLGATNSVLTLTNVQAAAAGDYQVVVTNSAGSTNSAIAHLKILVAPDIAGIQVTATNVIVSVMSVNGLNYTLEYKNSALDADWTPIAPSTPGTGGVIDLPDDTVPATSRLYRVRAD